MIVFRARLIEIAAGSMNLSSDQNPGPSRIGLSKGPMEPVVTPDRRTNQCEPRSPARSGEKS